VGKHAWGSKIGPRSGKCRSSPDVTQTEISGLTLEVSFSNSLSSWNSCSRAAGGESIECVAGSVGKGAPKSQYPLKLCAGVQPELIGARCVRGRTPGGLGSGRKDGQQVLVVTNPGPAKTIELRLANMAASVPLKANSVGSLAWR
jgi:hypothetical protein